MSDRIVHATALATARDTLGLLPWELISQGIFQRSTFGRSVRGYEDDCVLVARGDNNQAGWVVASIEANPTVILAAGVIRAGEDAVHAAKKAANEALARIDPSDPSTFTPSLSEEDQEALRKLGLLDDDVVL